MKQHTNCNYYMKSLELIRWGEGDMPGVEVLKTWTQEVAYLRETETKIQYFWDGKEFDNILTLNDFYGFMTSCNSDDAVNTMLEMKLTVDDRLEIRCTVDVIDTPITNIGKGHSGRTEYEEIKASTIAIKPTDEILEKIREQKYIGDLAEWLCAKTIDSVVVWSSKWEKPNDKMNAIVAELKAKYEIEKVPSA